MITIGSRVKYRRQWLRSISCYTGALPFARGIVTHLQHVGETTLAVIDWQDEEIPLKVNVKNLVLADRQEVD